MIQNFHIEPVEDYAGAIQFLEDKLYEHNSKTLNRDDGRLFSSIVKSANNTIIAGIAGWTWADICEITQLWVDGAVRNKGIGKMLLQAAETVALDRGCGTILVRTYSFQAPDFYMKHGFLIRQKIDDFPPGHQYYILTSTVT